MLNGQKIIYVSIVDNYSKMPSKLKVRIWHHEKLVKKILEKNTVLMGRKTFELSKWKGTNTWIITKNSKYNKPGIGTIHDIEDLHLHTEGDIFILGGSSLFMQLEEYVDEIHLYVINNSGGKEKWMNIDMHEWVPKNHMNHDVWSYAHLVKRIEVAKKRKQYEREI